jgi:cytochrome b subunit of formate dehydrogenase
MKGKILINYSINCGLLVTFLITAVTGILKFPGFLNLLGISMRKMPMPTITVLHDWGGLAMTLLVLIHIILHMKWIIAVTRGFFKRD